MEAKRPVNFVDCHGRKPLEFWVLCSAADTSKRRSQLVCWLRGLRLSNTPAIAAVGSRVSTGTATNAAGLLHLQPPCATTHLPAAPLNDARFATDRQYHPVPCAVGFKYAESATLLVFYAQRFSRAIRREYTTDCC